MLLVASTSRRIAAEAVGTALLLVAVVGSGIMGERLSAGNVALALLANAIATGAALTVLILTFAPVSGAHFNPLVTLTEARHGAQERLSVIGYIVAQVTGAVLGVWAAHLMFGEQLFQRSVHARSGAGMLFSEFIATFGLLGVIEGGRARPAAAPFAVGLYIAGAYWFTASTAFANPAVTIARALTNTFAGIRPGDVPGFLAAQVLGALAAAVWLRWLQERPATVAAASGRR